MGNSKDNYSNDFPRSIHAVLIAGFWLGGWAWRDVEPPMNAAGIVTHPVTLPGLDGTDTDAVTLEDHIRAVRSLVEGLEGDVVLVGHSAGGLVAQGVIDQDPVRVRRVVMSIPVRWMTGWP